MNIYYVIDEKGNVIKVKGTTGINGKHYVLSTDKQTVICTETNKEYKSYRSLEEIVNKILHH